jgi:hypothetical protein
VTPTRFSFKPRAHTISVAEGRSEAIFIKAKFTANAACCAKQEKIELRGEKWKKENNLL